MLLSKKEISILIEIVYSIVFALIFLPYFYENQEKNLILMDGLVEKIIQIIIPTKKQINLHLPPQTIRRIYVKLS